MLDVRRSSGTESETTDGPCVSSLPHSLVLTPPPPPGRNSGLCHVCTGGKQHKAQKENGLVSGL